MMFGLSGVANRVRARYIPVKARLFLSYIAIFIVPLLVGSALALPWIERTERSKIEAVLNSVATQVAASVGSDFAELRGYAELFSESQMMEKLMYMQGDTIALERFPSLIMLSEYNQQFSVFAATKSSLTNLDVILNSKDMVFTTGLQIGNVHLIASAMFGHDDKALAWFEDLISQRHTASIVFPVQFTSRPGQDGMLFLVSLPIDRSLPVSVLLCIT